MTQKSLFRRGLVFGIIMLFVGASVVPSTSGEIIPESVYVDDDFNETTEGWQITHFDNIQDGIDAVMENGTVYVFSGIYYENVIIDKSINLIGEDRETTIIDAQNNGHVVQVLSNWTNLSNFTAKNAGPDVQDGTGVKLTSVSYVNISNVKCRDSEKGIVLYDSHNCILNNTECRSNEDYGILIRDYSSNNLLTNNKCIWNRFYNLGLIEQSSGNILINNTIAHPEGCMGLYVHWSNGNEIRDCTFYDNSRDIMMGSSHNNYIHGNQILSNGEINLNLNNCNNNIIINNIINNGSVGIKLKSGSNNNYLFNNIVRNNWFESVFLEVNCNYNIISHCVVQDIGNGDGIKLYRSDGNNIINCSVYNSTSHGIYLNESSNNNISGNIITDNNDYGIKLDFSSDNNLIYHNNFINNTINAYDVGNNAWDNDYPSGGNYWDDYSGQDNFSGPNQDIHGADGIGDIPYHIYGDDSHDWYPLMKYYKPDDAILSVIDINPNTLNLKSKGKWITCYIELPDGYGVADIDISTILMNNEIPAEPHPTNISDYDNDGVSDLMVKFDRQVVQDILELGSNVAITVTGKLFDETQFEGIDYIRVI